jgi:hypothetical protein
MDTNRALRWLRTLLAAAALLLLAWSLCRESHPVHPLAGGGAVDIGGAEFIESASYDGLMLKDHRLYDAFQLTPEPLRDKDCKT